jgi:flap endonuclease-1
MRKKHKDTVVEIEQNFKTRLERIVRAPMPYLNSPDFCCHGESDMEAGGDFAEISDIISSLERRGYEDMASLHKQAMKSIHISKSMFDDAKKLITLLGMPVVEAPAEAEAQCAALVKAGVASAVASEDMDALTFGAEMLLRGFNSKREPIVRIQLSKAMELLSLSYLEFVDLCILMGCDYVPTIEGVGPATAIKLINQYSRLEAVVEYVNAHPRLQVPEDFDFIGARQLFLEAETIDPTALKLRWTQADTAGLYEFLVAQRGFNPGRVNGSIRKLQKTYKEPAQSKLEKFFASPKVKKEA